MGDGDGGLLMDAEQDLRVVAGEIDEAVVDAAIAGAGIEGDVAKVEIAQRLRNHVGAPFGGLVVRLVGHRRPRHSMMLMVLVSV